MAIVKSWTLPPSVFAKMSEDDHTKLMKKLVFEVGRRLIMKTPVDTGRARGGWNTSISYPDLSEGGLDPSGAESIARLRVTMNALSDGAKEIYFSNAVEYIGFLNDGHSQQAPAGFVEMTLDEVLSVVK